MKRAKLYKFIAVLLVVSFMAANSFVAFAADDPMAIGQDGGSVVDVSPPSGGDSDSPTEDSGPGTDNNTDPHGSDGDSSTNNGGGSVVSGAEIVAIIANSTDLVSQNNGTQPDQGDDQGSDTSHEGDNEENGEKDEELEPPEPEEPLLPKITGVDMEDLVVDLSLTLDPFEMNGLGAVYGELTFSNPNETEATIQITALRLLCAEGIVLHQSGDTINSAAVAKDVFVALRNDALAIDIPLTDTQELPDFVLEAGETVVFSFYGAVNAYAEPGWAVGDISVSIDFTFEIAEPVVATPTDLPPPVATDTDLPALPEEPPVATDTDLPAGELEEPEPEEPGTDDDGDDLDIPEEPEEPAEPVEPEEPPVATDTDLETNKGEPLPEEPSDDDESPDDSGADNLDNNGADGASGDTTNDNSDDTSDDTTDNALDGDGATDGAGSDDDGGNNDNDDNSGDAGDIGDSTSDQEPPADGAVE